MKTPTNRPAAPARPSSRPLLTACAVLLSIAAGSAYVAHSFGTGAILHALAGANLWLLGLVLILGGLVQLVRAQRARYLLSQGKPVSLQHTFSALVVGHGLGDLVPFAPGGLVARCSLTDRLSGVPAAFSAGVFMFEGMLDGLGPAMLVGYLMAAVALPTWTRWILAAALAQSILCLIVPFLSTFLARRTTWLRAANRRLQFVARLGTQLATGLGTLVTRGPWTVASIVGFSLGVTLLEGLQLVLFLHAFGLSTSLHNVLLMLVLTLASNSIPLKIPGSGTVMLVGILTLAGIHGPGVAGYVLVTRLVSTSETTALALLILAWWSARRSFPRTLARRSDRTPRPPLETPDHRHLVVARSAIRP